MVYESKGYGTHLAVCEISGYPKYDSNGDGIVIEEAVYFNL